GTSGPIHASCIPCREPAPNRTPMKPMEASDGGGAADRQSGDIPWHSSHRRPDGRWGLSYSTGRRLNPIGKQFFMAAAVHDPPTTCHFAAFEGRNISLRQFLS